MERQSTIQQGVLKKKERRTQWQLFVVNWRWQRYTAILVRQRQAVGTERCGRSGLGKLLRKCGLQTKARGRRAGRGLLQEGQACGARLIARGAGVRGTAYCKEGRGRARLSPRRQTLAAKAEKTIVSSRYSDYGISGT
ncbi:BZ3500_MvSof-1268-A1-R1_Chr6-2g08549 [Microbotryum saponariae]|uniref:BZ3500_MvSof-1268-A1-R1_Chr6-2g08549 protein n=1 Tax=Microbotryum saponariae TaxID=289078 RepID=A0A2X0NNP4_9BASI|nr:BZ3500_MvSof-1268-A1-R1_Chr6-2g08549 [Microbotryum saponariae]SDA07826.1 BZ3501_MvSof-1269-A2-R1_Chr6-1g08263 [Microbotryum saponariae]